MTFYIIKGQCHRLRYLSGDSLEPVVTDVVALQKDLYFLKDQHLFMHFYIETIIVRIFYTVLRTLPPRELDVMTGQVRGINLAEFRRFRLHEIITQLDEHDINEEINFFSYKAYYVLYTRYTELEMPGETFITSDLLRMYDGHCVNEMICDRVIAGCGL